MIKWTEKEFEEKYSSKADNIYKSLAPIKTITRSKHSRTMLFSDKYLGIDAIIKLQNGSIMSIQEKLRNANLLTTSYPTLCIELINQTRNKNKSRTIQESKWFYAIPQLYFGGYVNVFTNIIIEWSFIIIEWSLIDTEKLKLLFANTTLEELKNLQKNTLPRKVNFLAVPITDIKQAVLLQYTV